LEQLSRTDQGVIAIGHAADELVRVGGLGSLNDIQGRSKRTRLVATFTYDPVKRINYQYLQDPCLPSDAVCPPVLFVRLRGELRAAWISQREAVHAIIEGSILREGPGRDGARRAGPAYKARRQVND